MLIRLVKGQFTGGIELKNNIVIRTAPAFRRYMNLTYYEVLKLAEKEKTIVEMVNK